MFTGMTVNTEVYIPKQRYLRLGKAIIHLSAERKSPFITSASVPIALTVGITLRVSVWHVLTFVMPFCFSFFTTINS